MQRVKLVEEKCCNDLTVKADHWLGHWTCEHYSHLGWWGKKTIDLLTWLSKVLTTTAEQAECKRKETWLQRWLWKYKKNSKIHNAETGILPSRMFISHYIHPVLDFPRNLKFVAQGNWSALWLTPIKMGINRFHLLSCIYFLWLGILLFSL